MISIKNAIVMLLMRREFTLIPTEEAIQSTLFYANLLNVKYNQSLLWDTSEPGNKWIMKDQRPWCKGITDILEDTKDPIVKKCDVEDIGPAYRLCLTAKAPKMNVEYERILNIIMKDFDIKKWMKILMIWGSYPVNQILADGDEIEFDTQ